MHVINGATLYTLYKFVVLLTDTILLVFIYIIMLFNLDCSLVHAQCDECSGEAAGDCLVCASGWFVRGGMCEGQCRLLTMLFLLQIQLTNFTLFNKRNLHVC